MPEPQQPPMVGRALGSLGVLLAVFTAPVVTAAFAPGTLAQKLSLAFAVFAVAFLLGTYILHLLAAGVDAQRPGRMPERRQADEYPDPRPDEPVHYVAWADRGKGCTDTQPHGEHYWHWRADMPYTVGQGVDGTPVHRTTPVTGAVICHGTPREPL